MKFKKVTLRNNKVNSPQSADEFRDEENFLSDDKDLPVQRNSANARERARMRVLSSAFYRLKTIIPWVPHDTKLSKLDTLRLARNYIAYLSATLDGQQTNNINIKVPLPQKMTWPYIFQVPELADLNFNKNNAEPHTYHDSEENNSKDRKGHFDKYSDTINMDFEDHHLN